MSRLHPLPPPAVEPAAPAVADATPVDALAGFRDRFRDTTYFSVGREWTDYAPAYRCGLEAFAGRVHGTRRFEDIEAGLQQRWPDQCDGSRLCWAEARGAIADAWQTCCSAICEQVERREVPDEGIVAV